MRKRLTVVETTNLLKLIGDLPILTDEASSHRALREVLVMARASGLTTYDASYLELAIRSGRPLATKDHALLAAARQIGVIAIPTRT